MSQFLPAAKDRWVSLTQHPMKKKRSSKTSRPRDILEPNWLRQVVTQPVWIGFTRDDVISAITKAMTRRYQILVKHGMTPEKARFRVPRELEKSLNRLMKDFVFPEEMSSECKLDDLDEDGE